MVKKKNEQNTTTRNERLLIIVNMNYHKMYPTKGYRALRKDIKIDTGWIVSYYLMYTCFREIGIYSKAKRRAFRRPKGVSDKYSKIIGGDWSTNGVKYEWNYHVDVYNNEIVGSDVANYKHCNGVMNHLRSLKDFLRIKEARGYSDKHTILHSDQGIVYASKKFEKTHKDYPITRSRSRAATPTDNPVIESLN